MRFFLILVGYVLAALGGCAIGLVGTFNWALERLGHSPGQDFNPVVFLFHDVLKAAITLFLSMVLAPLALIALAVIISEAYGVRSWFAWSIGLGVAFAAVPSVLLPGQAAMGPTGFFVAGFIAGTLYWLVAGRGAGRPAPATAVAETQPPAGG